MADKKQDGDKKDGGFKNKINKIAVKKQDSR